MRVSLHTVICCCVFTTVLSQVHGEKEEPVSTQVKRFCQWLQKILTSRPYNSSDTATEQISDVTVELMESNDGNSPTPPSSCEENTRSKRSAGCNLGTCLIHKLYQDVYELKSASKRPCAPEKKIITFGRRRRHSLGDISLFSILTRSKAAQQP
ncbi:pro-adrenomedullin [Nothobranchius furzeri]|uniref:Adrenomedullin n=2 Tax=Nothobranchius furzeri TaxID=105023 RepID=A0A1A8ARX5_NOTFU|nr:uncharacterized protein LOC107373688 [Nothobranchius furzeri]KAF7225456.1 putative LOC107373688-like protein [Nothobranchius furzeri]